jgi:hypothetical protein
MTSGALFRGSVLSVEFSRQKSGLRSAKGRPLQEAGRTHAPAVSGGVIRNHGRHLQHDVGAAGEGVGPSVVLPAGPQAAPLGFQRQSADVVSRMELHKVAGHPAQSPAAAPLGVSQLHHAASGAMPAAAPSTSAPQLAPPSAAPLPTGPPTPPLPDGPTAPRAPGALELLQALAPSWVLDDASGRFVPASEDERRELGRLYYAHFCGK